MSEIRITKRDRVKIKADPQYVGGQPVIVDHVRWRATNDRIDVEAIAAEPGAAWVSGKRLGIAHVVVSGIVGASGLVTSRIRVRVVRAARRAS